VDGSGIRDRSGRGETASEWRTDFYQINANYAILSNLESGLLSPILAEEPRRLLLRPRSRLRPTESVCSGRNYMAFSHLLLCRQAAAALPLHSPCHGLHPREDAERPHHAEVAIFGDAGLYRPPA
jgi:hypothetical protein